MTAALVPRGGGPRGAGQSEGVPTPRQRVADLRYLLRIWRACSHPLG